MNKRELEAYRERKADLYAKLSEARSNITRLNEQAQQLMVKVGKGDRTVTRDDVREKGWSGIPTDIPANMYPNRRKRNHYIDYSVKTTTTRRIGERPEVPKPAFTADLRASDISGRGGRGEKSDRIMRDALKGYSNRTPVEAPNQYQQWAERLGIGQDS